MPATIHDVAKKAKVGIGTVSSVLNNSRPVNEETRKRVLAAIAELDFVPNSSGRRLSLGKTHMIGVVIPYFSTPSQVERLRGAMSVLVDSEYDVSLFTVETASQRRKILKTVPHRGRIDGLIIFSLEPTEEDLQQIVQKDVPTVLVESKHAHLHSIYLDDVAAAKEAVRYLITLGHRKIGFISDKLNDSFGSLFSRNRYKGYCQALKEAGIPINPEYHQQGSVSRDKAREMTLHLLQMPDPPTAIFAYSDVQALGVLEAARDLHVDVPNALSVIGYDDIEIAYFARLTTVRQQLYDSGVKGVRLLFDVMNNPNLPLKYIQLPTELVIRQTTAPPPQ
ncbi:MAG: LacI family DNA-binding transcriptional regulator [Anaerolineae bacterium]|nr:LacI family DNA-binding transcriptional regulator [Anaerolineae bacterium]